MAITADLEGDIRNELDQRVTVVCFAGELSTKIIYVQYNNVRLTIGVGNDWMTVYGTELLEPIDDMADLRTVITTLKQVCKQRDYDFGYSCAETSLIKNVLYKLRVPEREPYAAIVRA